MTKGDFKKLKLDVPVNFAELERDADYFLYFYRINNTSKIVLSEKIDEKDMILVCNQVIDAIKAFKQGLGKSEEEKE